MSEMRIEIESKRVSWDDAWNKNVRFMFEGPTERQERWLGACSRVFFFVTSAVVAAFFAAGYLKTNYFIRFNKG